MYRISVSCRTHTHTHFVFFSTRFPPIKNSLHTMAVKRKNGGTQNKDTAKKKKKQKQDESVLALDWLPSEMWVHIFRQLSPLELIPVRNSCSQFHTIVQTHFLKVPTTRDEMLRCLCSHKEPVSTWRHWCGVCHWDSVELYKEGALSWNVQRGQLPVFSWLYNEYTKQDLARFEYGKGNAWHCSDFHVLLPNELQACLQQALLHGLLSFANNLFILTRKKIEYDMRKLWKAGMRSNRTKVLQWLQTHTQNFNLSTAQMFEIAAHVGSVHALNWLYNRLESSQEWRDTVLSGQSTMLSAVAAAKSHSVVLRWLIQCPALHDTMQDPITLELTLSTVSQTGHSLCTFTLLHSLCELPLNIISDSNALWNCITCSDKEGAAWLKQHYPTLSLSPDRLPLPNLEHEEAALPLLQWLRQTASPEEWQHWSIRLMKEALRVQSTTLPSWLLEQEYNNELFMQSGILFLQEAATHSTLSQCRWIKQHFTIVIPNIKEWKRWMASVRTVHQQLDIYDWLCAQYGFCPEELLHESECVRWSDSIRMTLYACGWQSSDDDDNDDIRES